MTGAFRLRDAARYIGMGEDWLWRDAPIPRSDLRKPGASRPVWVWRKIDLDKFLEDRQVLPGHESPFGQ